MESWLIKSAGIRYINVMMGLKNQKCIPCEGGTEPLKSVEFEQYLGQISKWQVVEEKKLEREVKFKNFKEALNFLNSVGEIAESEGHHPDFCLFEWNNVKLILSTHAIGGLSINDFVMAAKIDSLLNSN